MSAGALRRMPDPIRAGEYVVTLHAEEVMADEEIRLSEFERCFLTGEVLERQRDRKSTEWQYRIRDSTAEGGVAEVLAKIGVTGKVVVTTVYRVDRDRWIRN
ncbi:MAG: DUF4258 domain-containing protein [Candidatus Omnitrophica bacterium]|nr:hypothetical protein [bacterium]NUN94753.1 DUF4258 domain-containing protein [Candidatus Omnitrophota bacterium]